MQRGHNSPLAARGGDPLERLRDGIIEDFRTVEKIDEIAPVLLAALERIMNLLERGNGLEFSTGKSVAGAVRCTHDQRGRKDCRSQ